MKFFCLLTMLLVSVWGLAQSPFPNVVLDDEQGMYKPCEPSIAIDYLHPDTIVAGAILNRVYYSHDGGKSWQKGMLESPYGVFGDPCLLADHQGHFYYLHLSNPSGKGWNDESLLDRIVCQRSDDGGQHWSEGGYMGLNQPKDQDKEWAVADPQTGAVFATWTQFDRYNSPDTADQSHIFFARSDDQGAQWSEPIRLDARPGNCLDDDGTTEGAVPAVGPNGELYVAWALDEQIFFDRSLDGGQTWLAEDRKVADQPGGWNYDVPGINRCNGLPVTICDHSEGPQRGTIYVNWTDQRHGAEDTDVWLAKSTDGGDTWSAPIRVNDDSSGRHQFFSWLAVDQASGDLYCVFYDRRHHPGDSTDVYLAYSQDGGETFRNVRISETPFKPRKSVFFGDYNHLAAHRGVVFPIWTRMDGRDTKVLTARIEAAELRK
jgi:hypothetical protein